LNIYRIIPLYDKIIELLDKYLSKRFPLKNNALFIGRTEERIHHNSLKNLFDRYIKIAGLSGKGYTTHTLRHYVECYIMVSEAVIVR
jgi:integrase/recombinase XerD